MASHSEQWLRNRQFGIVIDAGSSGSRIHIYSWINRKHLQQILPSHELNGVLPTIEPGIEPGASNSSDWNFRHEPGIAEFKDRPEDVGEHLEPLLDHALAVIPESEIPHTPIYLLATAGLRLVQEEVRMQILANTCSYVRENYKFYLGECKDHIKNISGEEEGIYGWVAINYLMGGFDGGGVKMIKTPPALTLDSHETDDRNGSQSGTGNGHIIPTSTVGDDDSENNDSSGHRHTLGFLDMGGASTQIAFEPAPQASQDHFEDLTSVKLRTLDEKMLEFHVFVTTFLGYGSNQARRRYVKDYLLQKNKEFLEQEKPGVQVQIVDPCLPKNLQLSETHLTPHVNLMGSGSFKQCLERVEALLNKDVKCYDEPCLFNGVHTPPIDFNINTFIGVSEYWYSSHDILGLGGAYDYAEFERKSAEFCNSEWDDIKDQPDYQEQTQERLEMQCFKSAWLSNVLHSGFGLPRYGEKGSLGSTEQSNEVLEKAEESIRNKNWRPAFQSINAIKDIQVTWTLGAMLLINSGSLGPSPVPSSEGGGSPHRSPQMVIPPADHQPPHEESYPERMLDNYNHFMLVAIVLFALAIFWVYRSRPSRVLSLARSWLGRPGSMHGSGGDGQPIFGRFRRTSGPSSADYSSLESGTPGTGSYARHFNPKANLKVFYLSLVHHTRSIWWSISSRIWPEPTMYDMDIRGEDMNSIAIGGFDANSTTVPMTQVGIASSHHGGTPAGSFGTSGLTSIPESITTNPNGIGSPTMEHGYHPQHHRTPSRGGSGPPKSMAKFFRTNKKRFSGDSHSLFKDGHGVPADGCVVNTALLQKGTTDPQQQQQQQQQQQSTGTGTWKQGWIPEEDLDDTPIPSLLATSRSFHSQPGGHSPLLTPMAKYKQQQQDGSSSAPSSSLNLAVMAGGGSGFVTSADEREEWSNDGGDGDDEGDGYFHQRSQEPQQHHSQTHRNVMSRTQSFQSQSPHGQTQTPVSGYPHRPASAAPYAMSSRGGKQHNNAPGGVVSIGSRYYKQRSTGLLSGINFDNGGGAMTSMDQGNESVSEAGYMSGGSLSTSGGYGGRRPSATQVTTLASNNTNNGYNPNNINNGNGNTGAGPAMYLTSASSTGMGISRSSSPMMLNQQQNSSSTSSLVLGRHNISEADQQLVSRGSSENLRRGSLGLGTTMMSP
ncbi:Golgi apyrase [Lunasporangiospora selenospora]|uniref:Golgi apyrase n=1 Tax=Lunasporangiospora selenospora TaxID=979761 RepID=A0A9P6FPB9_9FUNG|nr:Golgi apyrase [Lunasporangiospora selenospora]